MRVCTINKFKVEKVKHEKKIETHRFHQWLNWTVYQWKFTHKKIQIESHVVKNQSKIISNEFIVVQENLLEMRKINRLMVKVYRGHAVWCYTAVLLLCCCHGEIKEKALPSKVNAIKIEIWNEKWLRNELQDRRRRRNGKMCRFMSMNSDLVGHFVARDEHTSNSTRGDLVVISLWRKMMTMMMQTIG